ncbi:DUF4123 domain-containing protein [Marinobacter sp. 1-3A]|uniref:DUF4123 domain-containing protein n=1 Tax=Marinobacter sp. 1-3A TaxID=2582920 RepID=UPI001902DE5C|nr:DUF4123 domain-containing protein [Marinobacter sp. 1-3A]MBK1873614.1 DUF4123 domain-containing protein [Marinobacter sp. 1-3A]
MAEQKATQAILELAPSVPFVILDLAYHPSVLAWIYEEIEARSPGSWRPLLFGTAFQERWQMGPALIDLRSVPGAQDALINKYKDRFPGVFLAHPTGNLDELAVWLQQFLLMSQGAQQSLMRIYDGRVLRSFLSVLDQQQYKHFVPSEACWYWQNDAQWWKTSSDDEMVKPDKPNAFTWHFRDSQVDEFTAERNRAFIDALTNKYGKFTPSENPRNYVDNAAKLADAIGLDSKADIEKVLRLLIQQKNQPDAPFYSSLIKRVDLTAYQKLDAIENGAS